METEAKPAPSSTVERAKCDVCGCEEDATIFVFTKEITARLVMYPGAIIPCDDPKKVRKYCEQHGLIDTSA